jgi:hypothetical protein
MLLKSQTLSTCTQNKNQYKAKNRKYNTPTRTEERTNLPFRVSLDWQAFLTLNLTSFWNLDFEEGCAFAAVLSHYFSVV